MKKKNKVGWFVTGLQIDVASVRYRGIYPAVALRDESLGEDRYESVFTDRLTGMRAHMADLSAIVVVKRLDNVVIRLTSEANDAGVPVILDLCDDVLDTDYRNDEHEVFKMTFDAVGSRMSAIVVTGETLKRRLIEYGVPEEKIQIVPDCIETDELIAKARKIAPSKTKAAAATAVAQERDTATGVLAIGRRAASTVRRPRRTLKLGPKRALRRIFYGDPDVVPAPQIVGPLQDALAIPGDTVVWFGSHGGPNSDFGMLALLGVAEELRRAHARAPFTLIVVSNHELKYRAFVEPLGLPSAYVPWSQVGCRQILARASACIVPQGKDRFSLMKSANRPLLALDVGAPVVAQPLESLELIADEIVFHDFEAGLVETLTNKALAQERRTRALEKAHKVFGVPATGRAWATVLNTAQPHRKVREWYGKTRVKDKLLVCINLVQDAPTGLRVHDEAIARGFDAGLLVSETAITDNRKLLQGLIDRGVAPTVAPNEGFLDTANYRWLRSATALFCPSETSAQPHQLSHRLTRLANDMGVRTFTAQHGYENLGLTYRDSQHPDVSIASQTVFLWNHPSTLSADVDPGLVARCIGVGRIADRLEDGPGPQAVKDRLGLTGPIIGVFENLHWKRYDKAYRSAFAANVLALGAALAPQGASVLVAPHPAGLWSARSNALSKNNQGVIVADIHSPQFTGLRAVDLICAMDGVITTPSTIVVDAAEAGVPVGVFTDPRGDMSAYAGAPQVPDLDAWKGFAQAALAGNGARATPEFLARARMEGDPLDHMFAHIFPSARQQAASA